jgi:NAD-dependent dihydropyrimidine dehydrogenase PreA subunit
MAYVITSPCVGQKDASCVDVCPVDCIHPTPDEPGFEEATQLYIEAAECIDCDACLDACPVDAPMPLSTVPPSEAESAAANAAYFA